MKTLLVILTIIAMSTVSHARLGYTLDQCRKEYGKEVSVSKSWTKSGLAYGFSLANLYIYAIIDNGNVVDIEYFNSKEKTQLSGYVKERLWIQNQNGKIYDNNSKMLWNGRKVKKSMGFEHVEHWVEYSWDSTECEVANNKDLGWQIRTLDQFKKEQAIIKNWKK